MSQVEAGVDSSGLVIIALVRPASSNLPEGLFSGLSWTTTEGPRIHVVSVRVDMGTGLLKVQHDEHEEGQLGALALVLGRLSHPGSEVSG